MTGREFSLKYGFKDVGKLENSQNLYSPEDEHFGVKWKIRIRKFDGRLGIFLCTNVTDNQQIHADYTMKMISKNKENNLPLSTSHIFEKCGDPPRVSWGWDKFIKWKTLEDEYLTDGKLVVEVHVKVNKMVGFPKEKLRSFGDEMQQFSDVILKVKDQKFYVSKLYLSYQSPYFATLFSGAFQESGQSEIELKEVNSEDLHHYLDILYGGNGINDHNVKGILSIADMYNTQLVVEKCEKFLVKESEMALKKKLELAGKYRLVELREVCLDQIQSKEDLQSVVSENINEMDPEILGELFKKTIALI
ncbi:hypothetical protein B9Z55_007817 [Caenorhabditis nigoni]|nr:hypothetical protein B9Z55_007817 [Caenorhabditis nigoni]